MIESLEVLDVSRDNQIIFANKAEQVLDLIGKYQVYLTHLKTYFNNILQKAFVEDAAIDENSFFEDIISNLTQSELKEKNRLNILIDWINKKQNRFTSFNKYNDAYQAVLTLLEDGVLEQGLAKNEIVLKTRK